MTFFGLRFKAEIGMFYPALKDKKISEFPREKKSKSEKRSNFTKKSCIMFFFILDFTEKQSGFVKALKSEKMIKIFEKKALNKSEKISKFSKKIHPMTSFAPRFHEETFRFLPGLFIL